MYMQDVLQTLDRFWAERGCILWQPYHTEVGAGTSNPATFLRALGPEPWWVAYTEPSARPADGRYAENPNRLQHYYQYQVILKPSPPNVQELFLESFEALGLDLTKHDFRFVEDNWQSPSLGAWGLGWEAWLDGMEVLQFTYFQECGGLKLDVRACELTYGIERICMYLQEKESVYDLEWNASGITYGDIFKASEIEYCKYNFEHADTEKLFSIFDLWQGEAQRLLDEGLVLPAYDHGLRLSHVFNLLDARGAMSAAERGRFLLRVRTVAERCAKQYFAQREEMGFPLMRLPQPFVDLPAPDYDFDINALNDTDTLLLEIGVEELPHRDLVSVEKQAVSLAETLLTEASIDHGPITLWITPRRITLKIEGVPAKQPDTETEARGPKKAIAQDADGNWSVPAQKYAKGRGVTVDDIYFKSQGKDEYCFVKIQEKGKDIGELLTQFISDYLRRMSFGRSMGWENTTATFSRPVRWIIALHGSTIVPASWTLREESPIGPHRAVYTGRTTYGHRRLSAGPIEISDAGAYLDELRKHNVLAERDERLTQLKDRVQELCDGLKLIPEDDAGLYEEICDLTEWPEPIVGTIPEDALVLPEQIIITPMKVHQRYIPVRNADGTLSKYFICVANGEHTEEGRAIIKTGNERVLNARLRDAKFFWDADLETPLSDFGQQLSSITFHQKLGTVADKIDRIRSLYETTKGELPTVDAAKMELTFTLMKADLTTQMVGEFDSLEGVVGMLYAREQGIDGEVADAILDHRLPRRAGDQLPSSPYGIGAGVLDRFDTLAGYFGIGVKVKGTSDPLGLRRNALTLLAILEETQLDIDLDRFAASAIAGYGDLIEDPEGARKRLLAFFADRLAAMARDKGYAHDKVGAALQVHGTRPVLFRRCLDALCALEEDRVQRLAEQAKRIERIVKEPANQIDAALVHDDEKALHDLCDGPSGRVSAAAGNGDFSAAFVELVQWIPIIDTYFEKILVNDEDDAVRQNRHAMLQAILEAIRQAADLTQIEKREVAES
jgi:glycyl-tRNA synthetase